MKNFIFIGLFFYSFQTFAIDELALKLGTITGSGWKAHHVVAQISDLNQKKTATTFKIQQLTLPALKQPLKKITLTCSNTEYAATHIRCHHGQIYIKNLFGKQAGQVDFTYHLVKKTLTLNLTHQSIAKGQLKLAVQVNAEGWQVDIDTKKVMLSDFVKKISPFFSLPQPLNYDGNANLNIIISGENALKNIEIKGDIQQATFSNETETQIGQALAIGLDLTMTPIEKQWEIAGDLALTAGEIYIEPIYIGQLNENPIKLKAHLVLRDNLLLISYFDFSHKNVISMQGYGDFTFTPFNINELSIRLQRTALKQLYLHYLESWLSSLDQNLEVSGEIEGQLDWQPDKHKLIAQLYNINLESTEKTFNLQGLEGRLHWQDKKLNNEITKLRWQGGHVHQLRFGQSHLAAYLSQDQVQLLSPLHQPLLDGALKIDNLEITHLGKKDMTWQLSGMLTPISMHAISDLLGLPELQGQLSGKIPLIRYRNQRLEVGGKLLMLVFGGEIIIQRLRLDEPFGEVPILKADIDINKINLKSLADITEFGEIQGHLSGYVHNLYMIDWQPVAFDMYLGTPEDNTLPRTISQKAVNNITSLSGGGTVNFLSRKVLSLFENFSYDYIHWGCTLKNGTCYMKDTESAKEGYYLVKGQGLPRIDVIGYNERINWHIFLKRLKRVINLKVDNPVVK